jgi:nitrite reductase/ring-hydroxylating ferredoxin subunit
MDSAQLVEVCAEGDIAPGEMRRVDPPGCEPLAVFNVDGRYYVTSNTCTHSAASLAEDGVLQGHTIECGWHYGAFDVRTGAVLAAPCEAPLRTYEVVLHRGKVLVRAP